MNGLLFILTRYSGSFGSFLICFWKLLSFYAAHHKESGIKDYFFNSNHQTHRIAWYQILSLAVLNTMLLCIRRYWFFFIIRLICRGITNISLKKTVWYIFFVSVLQMDFHSSYLLITNNKLDYKQNQRENFLRLFMCCIQFFLFPRSIRLFVSSCCCWEFKVIPEIFLLYFCVFCSFNVCQMTTKCPVFPYTLWIENVFVHYKLKSTISTKRNGCIHNTHDL